MCICVCIFPLVVVFQRLVSTVVGRCKVLSSARGGPSKVIIR